MSHFFVVLILLLVNHYAVSKKADLTISPYPTLEKEDMPTLPMLDILKELQTLQGLKQKSLVFSDKANELIERVHHEYGDEGASFMKATLQQWGLGDFIEATALPNTTLPQNDKGFVHHGCYQKVLPLC
ncbi:hypothetical protein, partial [Legionella santicrucis]